MKGKKEFYKTWWFWVLVVLFVMFGLVGIGEDTEEQSTFENFDKSIKQKEYTDIKVINNFVNKYNSISEDKINEIKDGNFSSKGRSTELYGLDVEFLDMTSINNGYIVVSIYGNSKKDFESMKRILYKSIEVFDETITKGAISQKVEDNLGLESSYVVNETLKLIFSAPNEYESNYRIDIYSYDFK